MAPRIDPWLQRRKDLMSRLDAAASRWPDGRGAAFVAEVTEIASCMEALAVAADTDDGPVVERVRTWRYAGDAWSDLASASDTVQWLRAAHAYRRADALLADSPEPVERMKLDFRYGRALFGLSGGTDAALVREARTRFVSSLALAREHMPEAIPDVQRSVAGTDRVLALAERITSLDADTARLRAELAATPSVVPPAASAWPAELQQMFGELRRNYESDVQAGQVSLSRQQALDPVLDQLAGMLADRAEGSDGTGRKALEDRLQQITRDGSRLRELMHQLQPVLARTAAARQPQKDAQASDVRVDVVWRRFAALKTWLAEDVARPHLGAETQMASMELYRRCGHADMYVQRETPDDAAMRAFEHDVLRPLTLDIRRHSLREQLMLVKPIWRSPPVVQDASGIAYVGGGDTQKLAAEACRRIGLDLLLPKAAKDAATARWEQLRACHAAIFDYTAYCLPAAAGTGDLEAAASTADVSYALGIAMALGRPVIILADDGQPLPFDVDIPPLRLRRDGEDDARLADGLDEVIYGLQRGGADTLPAAQAFLHAHFGNDANLMVTQSLRLIDDVATRDAVKFRRLVEPLLGAAGIEAPLLVFPAWAGAYPSALERRLFHVTAFGPGWAGDTRSIAAQTCADATPSVKYVRGDQVLDPDVILSIWNYLCTASHVLVDLTGLNANVALELGIADVLGRRTLLVSQDDPARVRIPSLAKRRQHRYGVDAPSGLKALRNDIAAFLAA